MPFTFSPSEVSIINAYAAVLTGDNDAQPLMDAYPHYVKLLKFKYDFLHKSIIYLNRYLVATIVDDANLAILTTNLEIYLTAKETNYVNWKKSRDIINALWKMRMCSIRKYFGIGTLSRANIQTI